MPGGVVGGVGVGAGGAAAALVEEDHAVLRGVKEFGVCLGAVAAGSTVKKDHWT